jgi:hypothetical protein
MSLYGASLTQALSLDSLGAGDALLVAGVTLVAISLLFRFRGRFRRPATTITPVEHLERMKQARGMRGDMEELMVEIEQMAKRLGAQLDAKAIRLEQVIREADQRIETLRRLQDGSRRADDSSPLPERPASDAAPPGVLGTVNPHSPSKPAEEPDDPLARSVYRLADQGLDAEQIAAQLREHVGKVELILALREA